MAKLLLDFLDLSPLKSYLRPELLSLWNQLFLGLDLQTNDDNDINMSTADEIPETRKAPHKDIVHRRFNTKFMPMTSRGPFKSINYEKVMKAVSNLTFCFC